MDSWARDNWQYIVQLDISTIDKLHLITTRNRRTFQQLAEWHLNDLTTGIYVKIIEPLSQLDTWKMIGEKKAFCHSKMLLKLFLVQWTCLLILTIISYLYVGDFIQGWFHFHHRATGVFVNDVTQVQKKGVCHFCETMYK